MSSTPDSTGMISKSNTLNLGRGCWCPRFMQHHHHHHALMSRRWSGALKGVNLRKVQAQTRDGQRLTVTVKPIRNWLPVSTNGQFWPIKKRKRKSTHVSHQKPRTPISTQHQVINHATTRCGHTFLGHRCLCNIDAFTQLRVWDAAWFWSRTRWLVQHSVVNWILQNRPAVTLNPV